MNLPAWIASGRPRADLTGFETRRLKLLFDESEDVEVLENGKTLRARVRVVNQSQLKSIEGMSVTIRAILLEGDPRIRERAALFDDCELRLLSVQETSAFREPKKAHHVPPGTDPLIFRLFQASRNCIVFPVCVARGRMVNVQGQDHWMTDNGELPHGKYRFVITARGKDVPPDTMSFIFDCDKGALEFARDPP